MCRYYSCLIRMKILCPTTAPALRGLAFQASTNPDPTNPSSEQKPLGISPRDDFMGKARSQVSDTSLPCPGAAGRTHSHRSHPHRRRAGQAGTALSASSSKRGRFSLHVSTATACQCQEGRAESILENEKLRLSKRVRRAVEASPGKAGRRARVRMGESTARSPIAASSKHTAWKINPARGIS